MPSVTLFIFGGMGVAILILLLLLGIWSEMDDKPRTPSHPPSDEEEIRKYLSGTIKRGGENVQKEKAQKEKEDS